MGVPWASGWEAAAGGAESWVGWKPTCGNADGCLYFFLAVFYSLCWVFRVGLVQLLFHRAAEVGSIGVASFSIELGF